MFKAPLRIFVASFLVLFLEVALIRWLPAQIRLLSYFSNFILLAAFLGIGIGALLGRNRRSLFGWYPLLQLAVIAVVYFFRLEVRINAPGSIYFTSGTTDPVTAVETTLLLPVLFIGVAMLFAALAQRMAREMTALPPLRAYTINLAGSLAGVAAFALASWLEAPPSAWFIVAFVAAVPLLRNERWTTASLAAV
ncbi:MAG: spermidine synthase, partial [Acidobacteria bacterium]|nr:spermidine synthase [Acidobacteriota bacterium]